MTRFCRTHHRGREKCSGGGVWFLRGPDLVRARLEEQRRRDVRVDVRRRAAVLEVAAALGVRRARDADRAAAVGDAERELVDRRGLVGASEAALVALAVAGDVLGVLPSTPLSTPPSS